MERTPRNFIGLGRDDVACLELVEDWTLLSSFSCDDVKPPSASRMKLMALMPFLAFKYGNFWHVGKKISACDFWDASLWSNIPENLVSIYVLYANLTHPQYPRPEPEALLMAALIWVVLERGAPDDFLSPHMFLSGKISELYWQMVHFKLMFLAYPGRDGAHPWQYCPELLGL